MSANLAAKEAATEAEAKPENKYDTRGLEQSYLAAGQAKRAEDLRAAMLMLKSLTLLTFDRESPIDISALVTLQDESGQQKIYFLLPSQGGVKLKVDQKEVSTVSPESPLGRALIDKRVGQAIELKSAGQTRCLEIVDVI